jgi:hypothetical protein
MTLPAGTSLVSADISTQNLTAATFVIEPAVAPEITTSESADPGLVLAAADPAPECPENPSTVASTRDPTPSTTLVGENVVQKPNQTNMGKKGAKMRPNSSLTARYAPYSWIRLLLTHL